jgi:pentatricopeptide repeat protein
MEMLHEIGYYYTPVAVGEALRQIDSLSDATMKVQVLFALFENYYFRNNVAGGAVTVLNRCYEIMKTSRVYEENPGLAGALAQNFGLLRQTDAMMKCYALFLKALEDTDRSRIEALEEMLDNCSEYLTPDIFQKLLDQTVKVVNVSWSGLAARHTLNVVGIHLRKIGQAAQGLQVVKVALERPAEPGMEEVVARLYVTAGQCALDLGDVKKAGEMAQQADELAKKVPRYSGMRDLFEVYCDLGDIERVKELMALSKAYDNFYLTWVDDLVRTAEGCSRWGRGEQAVKIFEEMLTQRTEKRDLERSEILGGLAREYAKRKDYTRVKQMIDEMQDEDVKSLTLANLASMGLRGADEKLLQTSVELARKMSVTGCGQTLLEIAIQYAGSGKFEQAFGLVETIRDPKAKSHALVQFALVYAKKGKTVDEGAKKHLRKILSGE